MRNDAMELNMKRCNGMSAVRVKAQEFSHVRDAPRAPREHIIALDVPHPLPSTVTSGNTPHQLLRLSPVALDLPHLL